jgi:hypothetical protein
MTLHALQAAFQSAVLGADGGLALLRGGERAARGLAVYRGAYRSRLRAALRDNYGVLHQALGDEAFDALADAYLAAHPPRESSIRWFGDCLAGFMAAWPALPHPALADLARLDWALRGAFDAEAVPRLDAAALEALAPDSWAGVALRLQPHASVLELAWAVAPAWHALADARERGADVTVPAPAELRHALVAWRDALQPRWRTLDEAEAEAIALIARNPGLPLGEWLEQAVSAATPLAQAVAWLRRWADDGLLALPGAPR